VDSPDITESIASQTALVVGVPDDIEARSYLYHLKKR